MTWSLLSRARTWVRAALPGRPAAGLCGLVKRWRLDTRAELDGAGLTDPRVTHLWDAGNVIDQGLVARFGVDFGGLDYDFFLLFDRDAIWEQRPPRPVSSGATVIGDHDRLADGAAPLLR